MPPRSLVLLALLSALLCAGCDSDPVRPPVPVEGVPNIILITLDTLRASHTTPYGSARDTTPNLAAFARQGVQFERAYAACMESRGYRVVATPEGIQ